MNDLTFISGWTCDTHATLAPPVLVQDDTLPCPFCTGSQEVRMPGEPSRKTVLAARGAQVAPTIWCGVWETRRVMVRGRFWVVWEFKGIR